MNLAEWVDRPELESPVLVVALEGWIDAGLGQASAVEALLDSREWGVVARFDTDALLDHRSRRPTMVLEDGIATELVWPSLELRASSDLDGNDVLLLLGAEPDHLWGAFTREVVDIALDLGTRLEVGLGAYPAGVPHTRPVNLVSTASDDELAALVGFVRGRIAVPAGVEAAIARRCAEVGLPAVGLWAQVPHYAAATMPYPAAGAALLEGLETVAGLRFDLDGLRRSGEEALRRLDAIVAENPEARRLVDQLELQPDQMTQPGLGDVPSAEDLADEVERFLRGQAD